MQVELEQRTIIKFLAKENLNAYEILAQLQVHLEDKAYALRPVRLWMGEVRRGGGDLHREIRSRKPHLDHIDAQILHIPRKSPFESAR
jgi:hypothetical protein